MRTPHLLQAFVGVGIAMSLMTDRQSHRGCNLDLKVDGLVSRLVDL